MDKDKRRKGKGFAKQRQPTQEVIVKAGTKKKNAEQEQRIFNRNMRSGGRAALDTDLCDAFLRLTREGKPLSWSCDLLGIPQQRFFSWVTSAKAYYDDPDGNKSLKPHYEFMAQVRRAGKLYLAEVLAKHEKGVGGEWVKYAWLLERLDPKTFGRKDLNNQQGPVDHAVSSDSDRYV